MSVKSEIESLLFVSSRPLTVKRLAEITGHPKEEVAGALEALTSELDARADAGFVVLRSGDEVQLATSPDNAEMVKGFLKDESFGELTRPALETLTIIGYRGPLTKAELEQIRGVNCSLILRNLMIRGLVETEGGKTDDPTAPALYRTTFDFLRYLGLRSTSELPDYEHLRSDENLQKLIEAQKPPTAAPAENPTEPQTDAA